MEAPFPLVNGRSAVLGPRSVSKSEGTGVIEDRNKIEPHKNQSLTLPGKCLSPEQGSRLGKDFSWTGKGKRVL